MAQKTDYPVSIFGRRVTLRDFAKDDLEAVLGYASDLAVTQYLDWGPNTRPQTAQFIANAMDRAAESQRWHLELGIVENASGLLIGGARITVRSAEHRTGDIGYVLRRARWGRGYGTETAELLIDFGFGTLGLHRIEATCHPDNLASRKVLERAGMQYEGRARQHVEVRGQWRDSLMFAVLDSDARPRRRRPLSPEAESGL